MIDKNIRRSLSKFAKQSQRGQNTERIKKGKHSVSRSKFESILICPISKLPLIPLSPDALQHLNARIQAGEIKTQLGQCPPMPVQAAFEAQHGLTTYYIQQDGIYYLLPEYALGEHIAQEQGSTATAESKSTVKSFYNDFGWHTEEGVYQDALDSEDLRSVSRDYILQCHLRLNQFLPKQGQYLLDVASGPVQYPAYFSYSENFDYRICADISLLALKEAQKRLGSKGLYVLCDITQLPFTANAVDGIVSLHTLYHVPREEQSLAFSELYRVLKPQGVSVVVYSWGSRSLLMNVLLLPFKAYALLKKIYKSTLSPDNAANTTLYFYAHSYRWFCEEIKNKYSTQLYSWRSLNVPFMKIFIHPALGGRWILKAFFAVESKWHYFMGKIGAYPLFVTVKK